MALIPVTEPPHQRPEPRTLKTDAGDLDLVPATLDHLDGLYRYWPMGIVDLFIERDGLVFQRGIKNCSGSTFNMWIAPNVMPMSFITCKSPRSSS